MSDLLLTAEGRNLILEAQKYLIRRRMSRFWKRNFAVEFESYLNSGSFTLSGLLDQMNVAHDPELIELYRLLGIIGGLDITMGNITIYVNATSGSDITGDGTIAQPYASLWFLENLPFRIAHKVRIILQTSVTTTEPIEIKNFICDGGSIEFLGVGMPQLLEPARIGTTWAYHGPALVAHLAVPFGVDRVLEFSQVTDGIFSGWAAPINDNSVLDDAMLSYLGPAPANGDSVRVIEPSIMLTCERLTLTPTGSVRDHTGVTFCNLKVITTSTDVNSIGGPIGFTFQFAKFVCPDAADWYLIGANINRRQNPSNAVIPGIVACGVVNLGQVGTSLPGFVIRKITEVQNINMYQYCDISGMCAPNIGITDSISNLENIGCGNIVSLNSKSRINFCTARGKFEIRRSEFDCNTFLHTDSYTPTSLIDVYSSRLFLYNWTKWLDIADYNLTVEETSQIFADGFTNWPAGGTDDIRWNQIAIPAASPWPVMPNMTAFNAGDTASYIRRGDT